MYQILYINNIYINIKAIWQTSSSKATYNKYICNKKVKHCIAVSTIRMFIESSAKHQQSLG